MKTIRRYYPALIIMLLAFLMLSCAPGDNRFDTEPAGFWAGLWHGLIAFVTFIISLFNENVHIYEVSNGGKLYDLGFILGVMIAFGGGARGSCSRRRNC